MSTEVEVDKLPSCDLCKALKIKDDEPALYDGATSMGPWAYMCETHFHMYGIGLGTGQGQRLIVREPDCGLCGEKLAGDRAELVLGEERKIVHAEPCGTELLNKGWEVA